VTAPPQRIADRYDILSPLGRGGMATTYLVRDVVDDSQLALKLLHSDHPAIIEALRFEFRTLQSVHHPGLCPVHDFGFLTPEANPNTPAATCFYTAEAIEGITLDLHAKDRSWQAALLPLGHALDALRLLHRVGVRHGDFKPANILVRSDGSGVLVDLGCARPLDMPPSPRVSGTPAFLSPELLQGEASDARADLFSVGVTLERIANLTRSPPPPLHQNLIRQLTQADPNLRPKNVDEVLDALGMEPKPFPPAATWRGRFVGRETLLASAQRAVDALLSNQPGPRLLSVSGHHGVGRTRLLQEIEWQAQPRCRVVRASTCAPLPVEDLLSRALRSPIPPGQWPVVEAFHHLAHPTMHPIVLLFDDVQSLSPSQRSRLLSVARLVEPTSRVLLIASTTPNQPLSVDWAQELPVEPLSHAELELWLAPAFGSSSIQSFHRMTGGYPDAVNSLVGLLRSGQRGEDELAGLTDGLNLRREHAERLKKLPPEQLRAIGLLALLDGRVTRIQAQQLGIQLQALEHLQATGFVDRHASEFRLPRAAESLDVAQQLPPKIRRKLHGEVAAWLVAERANTSAPSEDAAARSERAARVVHHLVMAGRIRRATTFTHGHHDLHDLAPDAWRKAVVELLDTTTTDSPSHIELVLLTSRLERVCGRSRDAIARLELVAGTASSQTGAVRIQAEIGACHAALGDAATAEPILAEALLWTRDPETRTNLRKILARTQLGRGAYQTAIETCQSTFHGAATSPDRAELLSLEGVAHSFLGDSKTASECLQRAVEILEETERPRAHVRALTSLALHELREGNLEEAVTRLQGALSIAQERGLEDHIANLALNLGVAHHQRGAWDQALASYEKGLRMAVARGRKATEAALLCNLARARADLGAFEGAQQLALRSRDLGARLSLPLTVASADAVLADVHHAQGRTQDAQTRLLAARTAFSSSESATELVEIELQLADIAAAEGHLEQALKWLSGCTKKTSTTKDEYLVSKLSLVRARVLSTSGRSGEALALAENAVAGFRRSGHRDGESEAHLLLSELAAATGAPHLSLQHLSMSRALWERAAATLPAAERDAFWHHPRRARARATESSQTAPPPKADDRMQRLLEINKRLNSSLRMDDVLRSAMDAAIELTGAERGFLLIQESSERRKPKLTVAIARNVDREQLGRSHLKFSRAIAREVIESGQPILSTDAVHDGRLQSESVHAMHLKSVACVPIHSPDGVLGALYLDNRFQLGRFSGEDVELLMAFADQAALALRNARLMDALASRNAELEAERRRVQELANGQAEEIERLHEQVRETRRSLTRRFEYGQIVGTSEPMQRVFDILDRVTDKAIPVLIQGESGTGKELVAQALHYNGPRRDFRLVSINCAALPEHLLESELFGHVRGAFTGADRDREGLVVRAAGGTLFLDEVAELSLAMQAKLLRVLQEREVLPVGASRPVPVDFRLVCATNRDLRDGVAAGEFREDLFYRIAVVEIRMPPLRERMEDIPALSDHILRRIPERAEGPLLALSPAALRKLLRASWPGNVRQLENVLTRSAVLARGKTIEVTDLDLPKAAERTQVAGRPSFEQGERARILELLESNRWNVRKVAPMLGLPRSTLYRKLKHYGIALRKGRMP
jgi:transcriptional regulator with GAF, ATPase, and Fis domain/serine/threonine protein kinase